MSRSFNGTTDKIDLATTIAAIAGTNPRSFSAWIKPTGVATFAHIFTYGTTGADNECSLQIANTASGDFAIGFSADNVHTTTTPVTANVWQHLGATYTGGGAGSSSTANVLLYYNGVLQARAKGGANTGPNTTNSNFGIGYERSTGLNFFPGLIADMACWNVVLTAGEMTGLAAGARPRDIRPASLQGWWPLDGLQSPEPDLSGNGINLTLTGSSLAAGPPVAPFTPRWPLNIDVPFVPPPAAILLPASVM